MDTPRLDENLLQSYILLTSEQMKRISDLFDVYDREGISNAVQTIVDAYIKEHTQDDIKKLQADNAWEDFTNKFNEGRFSK